MSQSLVKYCKRDDAQVRKWSADYEEAYGTKVPELVQDWRSHPSPPQQHHPGPSHSQPQLQLQPHGGSYHTQHQQQHQPSHRRLSDVPNSGNQGSFAHNPWPPQHAVDAYGGNSTAIILKRSPSNSPPMSYPLGRPPNSNNTSGNINSNRSMGTNQQLPSDTSSASSGRERAGQVSSLNPASSSTGSTGTVGPGLGHGNGGEIACSLPQNQQQAGKYDGSNSGSGREGNGSAQQTHARWSHSGAELVGGSSGEGGGSAIQTGSYLGPGSGTNGPGASGDVKTGGSGPGGNGMGSTSGSSAQRVFTDGNKSLPSLKASGLLDSWGSASRDPQKQPLNSAAPQQQQQPLHISPRRNTPPVSMGLSLMAASQHPLQADSTELRPSTNLVMPVGLQWLANESR